MFINIVNRVSIIFDSDSIFEDAETLKFLRAYCSNAKSMLFLGIKSTPGLSSIVADLKEEGYQVDWRESVEGRTYSDLVTLGEFAQVKLIFCNRDVQWLLAAMKAIGAVYDQQDGGGEAFAIDAAIIAGQGDEEMRLSRLAHLLMEAQASLPSFPPSMGEFADHMWGRLFDYFASGVGRHAEAVRRLETFGRVEGLAAKAVEIAAGVWVVDARESPPPHFGQLIEAMGLLPGRVMTLVRQRVPGEKPAGGPELGLLLMDAEGGQPAEFQRFKANELPPELAAVIAASPGLDMSDALWYQSVVPVFRRLFGPPTHTVDVH
jgi:hypothetical protein